MNIRERYTTLLRDCVMQYPASELNLDVRKKLFLAALRIRTDKEIIVSTIAMIMRVCEVG